MTRFTALSGAATGLQIGGPWGALIGGAVGGLTGLGGVMSGNAAAEAKQNSLNLQADLAADASQRNFAAAHERIGDNIHRQNAVNAVAEGGQISRQERIRNLTNRTLLSSPKQRDHKSSSVSRIQKDGKTVYRVKVK